MKKTAIDKNTLLAYLEEIKDPEIPVLSIIDLGIVRDITMNEEELEVTITPTYSGCPAMDMIATAIRIEMITLGFKKVKITTVLSPAWTTDWISEEGKRKLLAYGIAPPGPVEQGCDRQLFRDAVAVACPRCSSLHTHRISEFDSTACKALYQCDECQEPFDHFKCH